VISGLPVWYQVVQKVPENLTINFNKLWRAGSSAPGAGLYLYILLSTKLNKY
jgi:hypothetical protein